MRERRVTQVYPLAKVVRLYIPCRARERQRERQRERERQRDRETGGERESESVCESVCIQMPAASASLRGRLWINISPYE